MSRRIVFLGLSITSSWGNGHATTFRGLVRALGAAGHDVLFLERDVPWYAAERDLPAPPGCRTQLYASVAELDDRFASDLATADAVIVGSFVPDGVAVAHRVLERARGVRAFYDIDTPRTLADVAAGRCEYLTRDLVPCFDLYLSFAGGPNLIRLERSFGARLARPLPCSVDASRYRPLDDEPIFDLGYLGTHSPDRRLGLEELLLAPAQRSPGRRFVVGGPDFPDVQAWPANVEHRPQVAPDDHPAFYGSQRFTLNLTRAAMRRAGWSPSVRLFEAGACAVPVLTDVWDGIDEYFAPGEEILPVRSASDVVRRLAECGPDEAARIGRNARRRVLAEHTSDRRAEQLLRHLAEAADRAVWSPLIAPRTP